MKRNIPTKENTKFKIIEKELTSKKRKVTDENIRKYVEPTLNCMFVSPKEIEIICSNDAMGELVSTIQTDTIKTLLVGLFVVVFIFSIIGFILDILGLL